MKTLLLIRHGQARAGTENYDRLSELGRKQAQVLGRHLRNQQLQPDCFWAGGLNRQQQTGSIALEQIGADQALQIHNGLNEYDHTLIHPWFHPDNVAHDPQVEVPTDMTFPIYQSIIQAWTTSEEQHLPDNVEAWQSFSSRITRALHDIVDHSTGNTLALFSSGGVIASLVHLLDTQQRFTSGDGSLADLIWRMANASITTLTLEERDFNVHSVNFYGHLGSEEDELVTWI